MRGKFFRTINSCKNNPTFLARRTSSLKKKVKEWVGRSLGNCIIGGFGGVRGPLLELNNPFESIIYMNRRSRLIGQRSSCSLWLGIWGCSLPGLAGNAIGTFNHTSKLSDKSPLVRFYRDDSAYQAFSFVVLGGQVPPELSLI